jgi:hypothetical protein
VRPTEAAALKSLGQIGAAFFLCTDLKAQLILRRASKANPDLLASTRNSLAPQPGEIVQIDTLFVNIRPDKAIKHFTAYDPVAKWTVGRVANEATASSACSLIDKLLAEAPFTIEGIQVDGGS